MGSDAVWWFRNPEEKENSEEAWWCSKKERNIKEERRIQMGVKGKCCYANMLSRKHDTNFNFTAAQLRNQTGLNGNKEMKKRSKDRNRILRGFSSFLPIPVLSTCPHHHSKSRSWWSRILVDRKGHQEHEILQFQHQRCFMLCLKLHVLLQNYQNVPVLSAFDPRSSGFFSFQPILISV